MSKKFVHLTCHIFFQGAAIPISTTVVATGATEVMVSGVTEKVVSQTQALRNRFKMRPLQDEAFANRRAAKGSAEATGLGEMADDDNPLIVCPLCHTQRLRICWRP